MCVGGTTDTVLNNWYRLGQEQSWTNQVVHDGRAARHQGVHPSEQGGQVHLGKAELSVKVVALDAI